MLWQASGNAINGRRHRLGSRTRSSGLQRRQLRHRTSHRGCCQHRRWKRRSREQQRKCRLGRSRNRGRGGVGRRYGQLRDRLGGPEPTAKIPKAVNRAIVAAFLSQKRSLAAILGRKRQRTLNCQRSAFNATKRQNTFVGNFVVVCMTAKIRRSLEEMNNQGRQTGSRFVHFASS